MSRPARSLHLVICLALLAGALLAAPRPALACTPPPGGLPTYTPAERAQSSDIVALGTVSELRENFGIPGETATIAVERYLKGDGPEPIVVSGYGPGSICRSQLEVGARLIFYIVRDGAEGYRAYYKSQFDAVAAPEPATIAEIEAAVAGPASQLYMPLANGAQPSAAAQAAPGATGVVPLAALGLFALLGIVVAARRRP